MAQTFVNLVRSLESALQVDVIQVRGKRKIKLSMDGECSISIYPNIEGNLMITIRKKTQSVTITKNASMEICDLKETVLLCLTFLDSVR